MEHIPAYQSKDLDKLYDAILSLKNRDECYRFFEDLCTVSEIKAMSQRIQVAAMLYDDVKYQEISKQTGASTATISRVNRCLRYGAEGYLLALNRMNHK